MNVRTIFGAVLILVGLFVFTNRGASFEVGDIFAIFWPSIFILPISLFFHWLYFREPNPKMAGVLVPGGLLLTVGTVCQISMLYDNWDIMWPGFILAPAVGLFELYWFGGREKGLLIPITILSAISVIFFGAFTLGSVFSFLSDRPILVIGLIAIGAFLLIGKKKQA